MRIIKKGYLIVLFCISFIISGCGRSDNSNAPIKVDAYNVDDYVTLGEYKGIEIETAKPSTVTDKDVEDEINKSLEAEAKYEVITNRDLIQKGDYVLADYIGKKDGVVVESGSAKDEYIGVGSGEYVEGFENQLIGKKPGTIFDITVEYPKDYVVTDLAGQKMTYTISAKSINKKTVPVLNDEYVRKKSQNSKTVAEYKEEIKKLLQKKNDTLWKEIAQLSIKKKLMEICTVSGFPKGMIEKMTAEYIESDQYMAQELNKSLKDYIKDVYNMDETQYKENLKKLVDEDAKIALMLEAIEKKEKLTMTEEERNKAIDQFATDTGYASKEKLLEEVRKDDLNSFVQQQKVLNWLVDNANIVESKGTTS